MGQCKQNIFNLAQNPIDLGVALRANTFILEKLDKDFLPQSKVTVEGGDKPILHKAVVFNIPVQALQATADVKRVLLDCIEAKEKEGEANGT